MGNLIYNSKSKKYFKLSTVTTDLVWKSLVIEGSKIATSEWEKSIIIWISEKNQNLTGSGLAGFDVLDMGWQKHSLESQRQFLTTIIKNSIKNGTWNNFNYVSDSNIIKEKLFEFKNLLCDIEIQQLENKELKFIFQDTHKDKYNYCKNHLTLEIISDKIESHKCFVCSTLNFDDRFNYNVEEIELSEKFWNGSIYLIKPKVEIDSIPALFKVIDNFTRNIGLKPLGNLWRELNVAEGMDFLKNGLSYDLAFANSLIIDNKFAEINFERIMSNLNTKEIQYSFSSAFGSPWSKSYGCWNLSDDWTFNVANILASKNKILFNFFRAED